MPTTLATELPLLLQRTTRGGMHVSSPALPGWGVHAHGPHQLACAVNDAWTELAVIAYAAARGENYDLVAYDAAAEQFAEYGRELQADDVIVVRTGRAKGQSKSGRTGWDGHGSHNPDEWASGDDGRWISPGGASYDPDSIQVQRMLEARRRYQAAFEVLAEEFPDWPEWELRDEAKRRAMQARREVRSA